jgi:hypothetical protein
MHRSTGHLARHGLAHLPLLSVLPATLPRTWRPALKALRGLRPQGPNYQKDKGLLGLACCSHVLSALHQACSQPSWGHCSETQKGSCGVRRYKERHGVIYTDSNQQTPRSRQGRAGDPQVRPGAGVLERGPEGQPGLGIEEGMGFSIDLCSNPHSVICWWNGLRHSQHCPCFLTCRVG